MQETDGHFGTRVDKMARKRRAEARLTIGVLFLGCFSVIYRLSSAHRSVEGWAVTADSIFQLFPNDHLYQGRHVG